MRKLLFLSISLSIAVIASKAKQSSASTKPVHRVASSQASGNDESPPIPGNWQLEFEDNFDYLDTSKWSTSLPNERKTVGSGDACFFLDKNVRVKNGKLELISRKEKLKFKNKQGKSIKKKYSSGQINSFAKFAQTYGYFEARMKLPLSKGLWPAFWLMPNRVTSKFWSTFSDQEGQGMEIDIMEHLTEWGANRFHYAAHWDGYKDERQSISGEYHKTSNSEYRDFGLYWDKNLLIWFIDGQEIDRWHSERIANIPMHLILTTEMGGWATNDIEDLPSTTYIDHVKVWSGKARLNPVIDYNIKDAKRQGKWRNKSCFLISKKSKKPSSLTWQPKINPGHYKIYAKWPETKKKLKAPAKFIIKTSTGKEEVLVDQKQNANYWYPLGQFSLDSNHQIKLTAKHKQRVLIATIRYEKIDSLKL